MFANFTIGMIGETKRDICKKSEALAKIFQYY